MPFVGISFLKLLTLIVVAAIAWQMFELHGLGRKLSKERDPYVLSRHRGTVACIGCLTLIAIGLIELMVRLSPAPYGAVAPWLLWTHLTIDAMLVLVGAVTILRFNGLITPRLHGTFAYSLFVLFFLSFVSGSVMLYQLPL